jgi:hypothetical protein
LDLVSVDAAVNGDWRSKRVRKRFEGQDLGTGYVVVACALKMSRSTINRWGHASCLGLSFGTAKGEGLSRPAEAPAIPGDIIPDWWATSSRSGGRHHSGIMGGLLRKSLL